MATQDDFDDNDDVQTLNIDAGDDDGDGAAANAKPDRGDDFDPNEGQAQAADGKGDDEQNPKADQRIPKARFDEVNEARKSAERALAEAQAQIEALKTKGTPDPQEPASPPAPAFDVQAKEKEYLDMLMEGETEKATEIRMEINRHISEQAEIAAEQRIMKRAAQSELDTVSNKIVEEWPYLDTPAGADAIQFIVIKRQQLEKQGLSPAAALRRAADELAPRFVPNESDTPTRGDPNHGAASTTANKSVDNRTQRAIERGVKDSTAQAPALTAGVGNRQTKGSVDVENMDEDQFAKLTTAEKRKLRGD